MTKTYFKRLRKQLLEDKHTETKKYIEQFNVLAKELGIEVGEKENQAPCFHQFGIKDD